MSRRTRFVNLAKKRLGTKKIPKILRHRMEQRVDLFPPRCNDYRSIFKILMDQQPVPMS